MKTNTRRGALDGGVVVLVNTLKQVLLMEHVVE